MKNLVEDIQKKNATAATNAITKALRAKTVAAIAEARKQVAVEMFGDLSEAPHQEHRRSEAKAPESKDVRSQKRKDWDDDVRMPWPKDYVSGGRKEPGSRVGTSAAAMASHRFAEDELRKNHPGGSSPMKLSPDQKKALKAPRCNNCLKSETDHPHPGCKKFIKWDVSMVGKKPGKK